MCQHEKKKAFLFLLYLVFILTFPACNPKVEKHYDIGIVSPKPGSNHGTDGIVKSLNRLGYVDGRNATIYYREINESLEEFVNRMIRKRVNLLFSITTPITKKVKEMTNKKDIPVVFIVNDPINSLLVDSIKNPGGNLTGVQITGSTPKALEWLKSIFHDLDTIWVPVAFDTKAARQSYDDLLEAATKLEVNIILCEVKNVEDLERALQEIPSNADAVFTFHSILINSNLSAIARKAIDLKLPFAASGHDQYKKGALLSYGMGHDEAAMHAARMADSILRGANPYQLPVETADFFLGINLKTAREINVQIPDHVIDQANFVIR